MRSKKEIIIVFMALLLTCPTLSKPCHAMDVEAISMPSADRVLSFVMTGRVAEILVTEGDMVQKDALLAGLDDSAEKIKVRELRANAKDETRIKVANAELDQKKVDLKKLESAHTKGAVTKWELEHAGLSAQIAELSLQAVTLENKQNWRRYKHARSQLGRMRLTAPISGRVEKVFVAPGESVKSLDPVIQVIKIDPLWIDAPIPLSQIQGLTKGQLLMVEFPGSDETASGKIIHISSVVDAASDTLRIRLEVPNPNKHPAGKRVKLRLPEDTHLSSVGSGNLTITAPVPNN